MGDSQPFWKTKYEIWCSATRSNSSRQNSVKTEVLKNAQTPFLQVQQHKKCDISKYIQGKYSFFKISFIVEDITLYQGYHIAQKHSMNHKIELVWHNSLGQLGHFEPTTISQCMGRPNHNFHWESMNILDKAKTNNIKNSQKLGIQTNQTSIDTQQ